MQTKPHFPQWFTFMFIYESRDKNHLRITIIIIIVVKL